MRDPYDVLGVARGATSSDIKAAYRRQAKQHHPDRHPGDPRAAERFKEVGAAYRILGDGVTRARFDRGEIDAAGNVQGFSRPTGGKPGTSRPGRARSGRSAGRDADAPPPHRSRAKATRDAGGADGAKPSPEPEPAGADRQSTKAGRFENLGFNNFGFGSFKADDVFAPLFGRRGRAETPPKQSGTDRRYTIQVAFLDAAHGTTRRLRLGTGRTVDVAVPAGITHGQSIRLKGQGNPGPDGGPAGDALIEVQIAAHPHFARDGNDVRIEIPVTIGEAVLGARIEVPTVDGPVMVTVPRGSNAGTRLRLRGKGFPDRRTGNRGDQYVVLSIRLPDAADRDLEAFLERWAPPDYDVRRDLRP
jgi:DnaJ-class molecular chaperone